jgi:predicted membrane protein
MEMQLTDGPRALVSKVKLTLGIFFTALGVLMTLDNLGVPDAGRVLRYWPAVLIVIGVLLWRENRPVAVVATAIGALLLATTARWFRFSLFDLWPVILIAVGLVIVLRAMGITPAIGGGEGGGSIWAILTTRKLSLEPRELDGKQLVAFMGGTEIDLRDAEGTGDVHLEVLAMWGGIELRVPPGWEVTGNVVPIMGGVEMKTGAAKGGRRVIVSGLVLMAGMEVKTS